MRLLSEHLTILVVEDNPADLFLIEEMLRSSTLKIKDIYSSSRISGACDLLKEQAISLIILDLSLPDCFGINSLLKIKAITPKIPIIILTGLTDSEVALKTLKHGAQDYLVKGEFNTDLLVRSVQYSIERKNAEEKLILSEEKYKQMFYKNPFPAWIYDLETLRVLEVNDAAIKTYGYTREEFMGLTKNDITLGKEIGLKPPYYNNPGKQPEQGELCRHKKKNRETIIAEVNYYELSYSGKMAMQVLINDVTEKLRLEKELASQQKQRQQVVAEAILGAQEVERKILGAELHDNINQILATANLYISGGLRSPDSFAELILKGQDCIVLAIEEIRKLSKILITPVFITAGLKQAIEGMVADIKAVKKMDIITELDVLEDTMLSEVLKITIYRIIQEQLTNILKYADASVVNIDVHTEHDKIILTVADNGKGFDTGVLSKGVGMTNIQNRAELFNGKVEIKSSPGNGCRLKVELNIKVELSQKAA